MMLPPHRLRARSALTPAALVVLLLLVLAPAPASAADPTCQAPPGTAAIDQYCENVPPPTGGSGAGHGGSAPTQSAVPARTARQLAKHGAGALLALAGGSTHARDTGRQPAAPGSPLGSVGASLTRGDTIGSGLVWVLLAIALALGGAAWLRFRRRSPPTRD